MIPRIIPCFHSYGTCPTQFAVDLAKAMRYTGTLVPAALHMPGPYVEAARNKLVREFLNSDGSHMLMMDVDIGFEADAILKTFTIMEQRQADVIYGNYSLGNGTNSIFGSPENAAEEASVMVGLKPNMVYAGVSTGGTGWLMARRSLLERMQKECPGPWHWFARDLTTDGSDYRGEDISFGLRMWHMTPRPVVYGTTAVLLRHFKNQPIIPDFMREEAMKAQVTALSVPNTFEQDTENYLINGNSVVEKKSLSPEELERLVTEIDNAKRERETAPLHGSRVGQEAEGAGHQDGHVGAAVERIRFEAPPQEAQAGQPTD